VPLYEYECKQCSHRFEKIMKFSDEPIKVCPKCGGEVEQMVSAPAVQFKGSGWYVTDYAKKSGGGATKSSSGEGGSSTDSSTKSSSDNKTESSAPTGDTAKSAAPESKSTSTEKKSDK
jgi:putative FmdB family regulatory protein